MEHYGFFNGGAEYGQEEFNRYFAQIYRSGISVDADNSMQYAITTGSSQVSVGVGFAILNGFYHYNDSPRVLMLTADVNLPRIYRIIIQLNIANGRTQLLARAGAAASAPLPPEIIRTDSIYELSLGQYRISPNGSVELALDERPDTDLCGAIRPKTTNEYDTAMADANRRFNEWFDNLQGTGWRNIFIQGTTPGEAVSGAIWIDETSE